MLTRLLLVVDVLLVAAAGALGLHLHRIWTETPPAAAAPAAAPAPAAEPPSAVATPRPAAPSAAAYTVIAERNLFSPTRTEASPEPPKPTPPTVAGNPALALRPAEKPRLYGVVIGVDGGARAYLWDPQTKRVFGYKVGDSLAENRVEQISADRVTMRRGTDVYEVLLRDPSKPRPPMAQATLGSPGVPPVPGQVPGMPGMPGVPGVPPGQPGMGTDPASPFAAPGTPPFPGQTVVPGQAPVGTPGATVPPATGVPPRRPFPVVPGRPLRPGMPGTVPVPTQPQPSGDTGS